MSDPVQNTFIASTVPEQKRAGMNLLICSAGIFVSALISVQFQTLYQGNVPALFLPALFFFVQCLIGGAAGCLIPLPQHPVLKFFVLLIFFINPAFYCRETDIYFQWNGFFAGLSAVWAFRNCNGEWVRGIRDFSAGMIAGLILSRICAVLHECFLPCFIALILFYCCAFFSGKKSAVRWIFSLILLFFTAGIFVVFHPRESADPAEKTEQITPLHQDLILSVMHPPVRRILYLLPDDSVTEPLYAEDGAAVDFLRYGKNSFSFPRNKISGKNTLFDLIVIRVRTGNYFLMTREFAGELKEKLRRGGVVVFLTDPESISLIHSSLATCFTRILSVKQCSFLAASDSALKPDFPENSMLKSLEFYLFSKEEKSTAVSGEKIDIPSDRNYKLELQTGIRSGAVPDKILQKILSADKIYFFIFFACCILLFMIFRYCMAYYPGTGLRFAVFRDGFFGFLTLFLLLSSRALNNSSAILYSLLIFCFLLGGIAEYFIPEKWKKSYRPFLFLLPVFAWSILLQAGFGGFLSGTVTAVSAGFCMVRCWNDSVKKFSSSPASGNSLILMIFAALLFSVLVAGIFIFRFHL